MSTKEKQVFTQIFDSNKWGNEESVSGSGSTKSVTRFLVQELNLLIEQLEIKSMLDIPCGDFNWMQEAKLDGINYIGADIVEQLILTNQHKFPGRNFHQMDLIRDNLPNTDLIFCRDCFQHLPNDTVHQALANIKRSGSKYLLTTHFTWRAEPNKDIKLGQWRRINFELEPFNFPKPQEVIVEGTYRDKAMALWPVSQL